VKTTTTVREYDDQGRLVRETTTEHTWPEPRVDDGQWWRPPQQQWWWQNPVISYGSNTTALVS
jgi:hypothetical protein